MLTSAVLGEQGAPVAPAPPTSLRDALLRPHAVPADRAGRLNRALRDVEPDDTSVEGSEQSEVQAEMGRRMGVLRSIMAGKLFGNPFGQPSSASGSALDTDWKGGRPDDVLMAVPAKSGTTWALHIGHQLRTGGAAVDFDDQMDVISWLECGYHMYGHDLDADQAHSPRIIKSHLPWTGLPDGTKRLFVFRDLADAWLSSYRFILSFVGLQHKVPIAVYFPETDRPKYRKKARAALENLKNWWAHRNDPGVLVLFYDRMLANPAEATERIAMLMGIADTADGELYRVVTEQTSHAAMRAARGPSGQNPFDEHNLADLCAYVLGLESTDRDRLPGKVRQGGGHSGDGRSLPSWLLEELELAWRDVIAASLDFADLSAMIPAHEEEQATASAEA